MRDNDFGFKKILKNFLAAFNIEKGVIPTVKDLLLNPANVINSYIDGKGQKYFSPGKFFVTVIAIFSFLTWIKGGFNIDVFRSLIFSSVGNYDQGPPLHIINAVVEVTFLVFLEPIYRLPLLILPSAYISWIIFYKYRYNVAKHFVIHIYCWTFINLILELVGLFIDQEMYVKSSMGHVYDSVIHKPLSFLFYDLFTYSFIIFYYIYVLKDIFKLSRLGSIIKPLLFISTTILTCLICSVLILTIGVIKIVPAEILNERYIEKEKVIVLSKASKNYIKWIEDDNLLIVDAYTIENTDSILEMADGIILTGGEDINPLQYNDTINFKVCGPINYGRDTLERKLFDYAFKNGIPLIGVCRGMQMMNVASGGTLYGDIPTEIGNNVIHRNNGEVMHEIAVSCENLYYTNLIFPLGKDTFLVNSWHHQGLKDIAPNIHIMARSYDGLPEAAIMDTATHPFMIAVQFHPERLGSDNVIHKQMRSSFFNAIYN